MIKLTLTSQQTASERQCTLRGLEPRIERIHGVKMVYNDEDGLRIRVGNEAKPDEICNEITRSSYAYLKTRQRTNVSERSFI